MTGYEHHELMGHHVSELEDYFHWEDFRSWRSSLGSEHWLRIQSPMRKNREGKVLFINSSTSPVYDSSGNVIDYVSVARDVSLEVSLQEQINQIQKMDAVGAMAAGVAYDLKNALVPILESTRILLENIREDDPAYYYAGEILQETHKGLDLVDQLLTLSRSDIQEKKPVILSEVLRETFSILKAIMPPRILVRYDPGTHHDVVLADPNQIKQMLINLADNARNSMPGKRELLSISLSRVSLCAKKAHEIWEGLVPGTYAKITVRDTGKGMDRETRHRIFDPFFTTKEQGKGKGLGLPVVSGIIRSHQGAIKVASSPGKGSSVSVYLPVMSSTSETDTFDSLFSSKAQGSEPLESR